MIPWILVVDLLSREKRTLAELVSQQMLQYPSPGEINSVVDDAEQAIERVYRHYAAQAIHEDHLDGIALEFPEWRFNLRQSNTEPVVRLNLETRGDLALMRDKTDEVLALLRQS
jgi:phosphomannomutase